MRQLAIEFPQHGGKRRGAGRKPNGERTLVSHKARRQFEGPTAVHVTLRVADRVWNLRSRRCFTSIEQSLANSLGRFGLRVIEFTVLGDHLHLIVEADGSAALSRGMQGLGIRIAKALNRLMNSSGRVFADHYHGRLLTTPTELVNAIAYVLGNFAHHHGGEPGRDRYSSAVSRDAVGEPTGWLLTLGWRRARRIPHWLRSLRPWQSG